MTFLKKNFFLLDYKREEQSGPANLKIQKHYYFQKQYFKTRSA